MTYKPSGVSVNILDNPRIVNIGGAARIPAIVGFGPTSRSVAAEAVQRSNSGYIDYLSAYPTTGVSVSKVAESPATASLSDVYKSAGGNLYNHTASASVGATGMITWQGDVDDDIPNTGSVYYVWYTYRNTPTPPKGAERCTDIIPSSDWDLSEIWYATSTDGFNWEEQGVAIKRPEKPYHKI